MTQSTTGTPSDDRVALNPSDSIEVESLLDFVLERGYLDRLGATSSFPVAPDTPVRVAWIRLLRLPVHPTKLDDYDLAARWQNVLASLHSWGHRLVFLLRRHAGETHLYLGARSIDGVVIPEEAVAQLGQAALSQMPGVELAQLSDDESERAIRRPLSRLRACGAITGLPSLRGGVGTPSLQTLDQIALGMRDPSGIEHDFTLVVVADPVPDPEISRITHDLRRLGSALHGMVKRNLSAGGSEARERGFNPEGLLGVLKDLVPGSSLLLAGAHVGLHYGRTTTTSWNTTTEELDKVALYCEQLIDKHVGRLQEGRNLGFWRTGTYVLGDTSVTVRTVTGVLRATYSGDESYLEPIRVHVFQPHSGAAYWVQSLEHIPVPSDSGEAWQHPFGEVFATVGTPLTTRELSVVTGLPRRDVPGLRFVRNAVRFANNPPPRVEGSGRIALGHVVDLGVPLGVDYTFDVDSLARHVLICGVTGSGKSTTTRRLLAEVHARGLPTLVIEPAKTEYVEWALAENERGAAEGATPWRVFMPGGVGLFEGVEDLELNPFHAAQVGGRVDLASRYERFCALLIASMPMGTDMLPMVVQEAIYLWLQNQVDTQFIAGDVPDLAATPNGYPRLDGVPRIARRILEGRRYEQRVIDNFSAAVQTRVDALTRGRLGRVLNVARSTPYAALFDGPTVVNLSQLGDDRDRGLIMALLMVALSEYRISEHRAATRAGTLQAGLRHLVVIEEAHRLLGMPSPEFAGLGDPHAVVATMISQMLSEIRAYGQGIAIVDQIPGRLIPDAVKNTNLKIVHRIVARDDREAMANCMSLRDDQQNMIAALACGDAIVCGDLDDSASWVRVSGRGSKAL